MGRLIQLHGDRHEEALRLLPWYATGQLDMAERVMVDAHLAQCPACQQELRAERRLAPEIAGLDPAVERGWAALRARVPSAGERHGPATNVRSWTRWPPRVGWLIAAQVAFALVVGGAMRFGQPGLYHALGSAPAGGAGNIIVMFRPDAREADLRRAMLASGARIVDGPTQAGAYVLGVPDAARPAALATMRQDPGVMLAQPIETR